jgi:outer membrane protein assembly factor BamD
LKRVAMGQAGKVFAGGVLMILLGGCSTLEKWNPFTNILPKDEPTHSFRTKVYGTSALLDEASRFYYKGDFIEARGEYKRFLELHPTHPLAAFAQYRMGMCDFYQIMSVDRDPTPTVKAMADFQKVIDEFPDSAYVDKAEKKVAYCREHLSNVDFYIGKYYYRTKFYKAASYRFQSILLKYPDSKIYSKAKFYYALSLFYQKKRYEAVRVMKTIIRQSKGSKYAKKSQILLDYWKRHRYI